MPSKPKMRKAVTYGRFFSAIRRFCSSNGWNPLVTAASCQLNTTVTEKDLKQVSVFLEKHGAFYHPGRIQITIQDKILFFVINVAASERGRKALPLEVKALKRLHMDRPFGWFPKVYDASFEDLPMFLGDWFENFHEFHLTRKKNTEEVMITVWDGAVNRRFLSIDQAADVYRGASMILTACYDPLSARQIFPWHHAAGDFVVRIDGERATTRLITVRDYISLTDTNTELSDEKEVLDALMVFFIHLTLRMRLDRIDGVSTIVWAPDPCLAPVVDGFLKGLDLTARINGFSESFPDLFRLYFNHHDESGLFSLAHRICTSVYDRQSEETGLIKKHLPEHIRELKRAFLP